MEQRLNIELADLQTREDDDGVGYLKGRVVPYGQTIDLGNGRLERFARGAFTGTRPSDVVLLQAHDQRAPIGRGVEIEDTADGAYMEFRLASTERAQEQRQLVLDGVLRSLSVGFQPVQHRKIKGKAGRTIVEHTKVLLREVSTVLFPAYQGAAITAVRNDDESEDTMSDEQTADLTSAIDEVRGSVDELSTTAATSDEVAELRSVVATIADSIPAPPAEALSIDPLEWFAAEVRSLTGDDTEKRALADITGTFGGTGDASGLVPEIHIGSQLVHVLDTMRPLFARLGSFPAPQSGYARIPVVTQNTSVAARAGQKQAANSQAMVVTPTSLEAKWFDGAVDIALEIIATSDPAALGMIWEDMLAQYAVATEASAAVDVAAAATHTGAVIDLTSYATFIADAAGAARTIRKATRAGGDVYLGVAEADWLTILGLMDGNGRRAFATIGAENADGRATLTAEALRLDGGIEVFPSENLTFALAFNAASARGHDYGVSRVQAANVELMGQDVGVLGRTMVVPRIPAGILQFNV